MTEQMPLFPATPAEKFVAWVHTPQGRFIADRFIKVAYGCHKRGVKIGAMAIWERLRWNVMLSWAGGEAYKLNNNYRSHMARFAMDREPALKGFFETREKKETRHE